MTDDTHATIDTPHPLKTRDALESQRAEVLRSAAQAKRTAAVTRAETGLRTLVKNHEPVNFRNVARTAGVSINFLYNNTHLRARIESLRAQQQETVHPAPEPADTPSNASVVRVLTAKLKEERRLRHEEVTLLREQLAAAHGALLQHRRAGAGTPRPAPLEEMDRSIATAADDV